jgi:hypothetical protein
LIIRLFQIFKYKYNNNDYLSRLEKLAEMKKNGILTQEEFNILKVDIIKI